MRRRSSSRKFDCLECWASTWTGRILHWDFPQGVVLSDSTSNVQGPSFPLWEEFDLKNILLVGTKRGEVGWIAGRGIRRDDEQIRVNMERWRHWCWILAFANHRIFGNIGSMSLWFEWYLVPTKSEIQLKLKTLGGFGGKKSYAGRRSNNGIWFSFPVAC